MDSILIGQKLETLRHCISRIVERCPDNAALLAEDADLHLRLSGVRPASDANVNSMYLSGLARPQKKIVNKRGLSPNFTPSKAD